MVYDQHPSFFILTTSFFIALIINKKERKIHTKSTRNKWTFNVCDERNRICLKRWYRVSFTCIKIKYQTESMVISNKNVPSTIPQKMSFLPIWIFFRMRKKVMLVFLWFFFHSTFSWRISEKKNFRWKLKWEFHYTYLRSVQSNDVQKCHSHSEIIIIYGQNRTQVIETNERARNGENRKKMDSTGRFKNYQMQNQKWTKQSYNWNKIYDLWREWVCNNINFQSNKWCVFPEFYWPNLKIISFR